MAIEFNKMRKQTYAFSHSWELVLDSNILCNLAEYMPDTLTLRCKSSTIPKSTVRAERVKIYGLSTQVVLEDETEGTITLVFLEDADHNLYRLFSVWKDFGASHRTYAQGGRDETSLVSQSGVELKLLQPDEKKKSVKLTFKLYGVQPIRVELSNLDNNINFMTLTVTLKYDNFEVE